MTALPSERTSAAHRNAERLVSRYPEARSVFGQCSGCGCTFDVIVANGEIVQDSGHLFARGPVGLVHVGRHRAGTVTRGCMRPVRLFDNTARAQPRQR